MRLSVSFTLAFVTSNFWNVVHGYIYTISRAKKKLIFFTKKNKKTHTHNSPPFILTLYHFLCSESKEKTLTLQFILFLKNVQYWLYLAVTDIVNNCQCCHFYLKDSLSTQYLTIHNVHRFFNVQHEQKQFT